MDADDFILDDYSDDKEKKKKVDGKAKGNRTELNLVKVFNDRFGKGFSRTVASGARTSQTFLPDHAKQLFSGDLVVPENFAWVIECKGGYDEIDLNAVLYEGNKTIDSFLKQVTKDCEHCRRKPMLCWKRNNKRWLCMVHTNELKGVRKEFQYELHYREWTGVDLKTLLSLPDTFFFKA